MAKKISAVICTYNRYDVLGKAIESCIEQSLDNSLYDIWIIDNTPGAEDGEGMEFKRRFESVPNLHYWFEPIPGLSNARNVAMQQSDASYISYLDDDAIACKDWLIEVINGFESYDNVGVVGGQILPIWELERPSWLGDPLLGSVSVVDWGGSIRIAAEGEWFAGANISFDRKVLIEAGGFSTNLGRKGSGSVLLSNEENEVLEFIKQSDYQSVYNPKASVDHLVEKKRLRREWFRRRAAWQATSDFLLNSEKQEENLQDMKENIHRYLSSLPPIHRNVQGMYFDTDDEGVFNWQLSAIYALTTLNLAGFDGVK